MKKRTAILLIILRILELVPSISAGALERRIERVINPYKLNSNGILTIVFLI